MKTLLFLIAICFSNICTAQYTDTTNINAKILKLEAELLYMKQNVNHIQLNLGSYHKMYRAGSAITFIGLGIAVVGTAVSFSSNQFNTINSTQLGLIVAGIGSGLTVVGSFIMMGSYVFVGRASNKVKQ